MNASSLWAGNDYAYVYDRGMTTYSDTAQRVRVIRVFKEKQSTWSERASTMVEVNMLTDDGSPKLTATGAPVSTRTVRARDIIDRWEDFVEERSRRQVEKEEQARKRLAEQQREATRNALVIERLHTLGFSRGSIVVNYRGDVTIGKEAVEEWMNTPVS